MPIGVLFALLAYSVFAFGDATIKSFGDTMSVFQIAFFVTLFAFVPAVVVRPRGERWRDAHKMRHPWLMNLRGLCGAVSLLLATTAFTSIPLAEAYALIFMTPIVVVVLSVLILRETVLPLRWMLLGAGFIGVLLVVQPGFRELQPGHLAAAFCAVTASTGAIVLKSISADEQRISLLSVLLIWSLVISGIAMIPDFVMPTPTQFATLLLIGLFGGTGQLLMIAATRRAAASQIAPMHYSQIFWAIVLGAIFYAEMPNAVGLAGLGIIVASGIVTANAETAQALLAARLGRFGRRKVPQRDD